MSKNIIVQSTASGRPYIQEGRGGRFSPNGENALKGRGFNKYPEASEWLEKEIDTFKREVREYWDQNPESEEPPKPRIIQLGKGKLDSDMKSLIEQTPRRNALEHHYQVTIGFVNSSINKVILANNKYCLQRAMETISVDHNKKPTRQRSKTRTK